MSKVWERMLCRRASEVTRSRRARRHAQMAADAAYAGEHDHHSKLALDAFARRDLGLREYGSHFMPSTVDYAGVATGGTVNRSRSGNIWSNVPYELLKFDPAKGIATGSDFTSWGGVAAAANIAYYFDEAGSYKSFEAGGAITQSNTSGPTGLAGPFGVINMNITASGTHLSTALEQGGGNGGSFEIVNGNYPTRVAYECRFQVSVISLNDVFLGLLEKGGAAASFLFSNADALNTKSFIGFYWLTAAAGTLIANAGKNGQTALTSPGSQAITAATWYNLGFIYDSTQPGNQLQYYANNTLLGGFSSPGVTNFPTGVTLTPTWIIQSDASGTNAAANLVLDYWYAGTIFSS